MAEKVRRDQTLDIIQNFLEDVWYHWVPPLFEKKDPGGDQRYLGALSFKDSALDYLEELRRGEYECKKR